MGARITYHVSTEPTSGAARTVRRSIEAAGTLESLHAEDRRDALVVISELVTNAVAASPREVPVELRLRVDDDVVVEVVNRARIDARRLRFSLPPPDRLMGRGLAVVRKLSLHVELISEFGITTARAVLRPRHPRQGTKAASSATLAGTGLANRSSS